MTSPALARLAALATAVMAMTGTARAEGNRLLPFWGQPFPSGYAWASSEPMQSFPCPAGQRASIVRDANGRPATRCETVLHARG